MSASTAHTSFSIFGTSNSTGGYEHRPPHEPWLMVPKEATRVLTLSVDTARPVTVLNANDKGYVLRHTALPVCQIYVRGNQLSIRGLRPFKDIPVELEYRGRELRLMVSVKAKRTLPIIAHYVEHAPGLRTRMTREELRKIMDIANAILSQANVRLSLAIESVLAHERLFPKPPPGFEDLKDLHG